MKTLKLKKKNIKQSFIYFLNSNKLYYNTNYGFYISKNSILFFNLKKLNLKLKLGFVFTHSLTKYILKFLNFVVT